ncbi:MAG: LysR family transcriptional regulator [Mailhella sp.]|nr:LysR family transcriptional regulator [Mailhella sp.]
MIELHLMKQLVAFKEHKTLSKTASKLFLTQPSLSRSMKQIEELFGVPLFDREKGRLFLNANGLLAAELSQHILMMERQMVTQVRALDRSSRTLTMGCCTPGPIYKLMPLLTQTFPGMTIAAEIQSENALLKGLTENIFQFVVTEKLPESSEFFGVQCGSEKLIAEFPAKHPLAGRKTMSFSELNGMDFILNAESGSWTDVLQQMMPDSRFIKLKGEYAVKTVSETSSLPGIASDWALSIRGKWGARKAVPINDAEAGKKYHFSCLMKHRKQFQDVFDMLAMQSSK